MKRKSGKAGRENPAEPLAVPNKEWLALNNRGDLMGMRDSALGNRFLEMQLKQVRTSVEEQGELTEAAIQMVMFQGKSFSLTTELEQLRVELQQNPEGLDGPALRLQQKAKALGWLDRELSRIRWDKEECKRREEKVEEARQAAAVLPSLAVLEKIMRYETKLERQLYRAMAQLERLQRMRQGEMVPAPLTVEVSERL